MQVIPVINSVIEYLEKSAANHGDKPAFVDENESLTFSETRRRALAISDEIISRLGKQNNQGILVYLPKSVNAITAMLGTVYSGNFYTPTNVDFPINKVGDIAEVLLPALVLTDVENRDKLSPLGLAESSIVCVDQLDFEKDANTHRHGLDRAIDTDPVYVYFTSGSTGVPKGVTINHRNIIDYTEWACDKLPIDETTIFGNQSALYFDITTQDIYSTLKQGATMVIIPEQLFAFPVRVAEFIRDRSINFLYWVPSAYVHFANLKALDNIELESVRSIMFGGEVMPVKHLNYLKDRLPNLEFIANVYGPTEATVNATYYIVDRDFSEDESLPLGHVIENMRALVLDDNEQPVSGPGRTGELCVMGTSVSPGYYRNIEKSSEVFVQNPLHDHYREIVYRTGDLVTFDEAGLLVFCGRKDNQIKHLGYRIELGEIEATALSVGFVDNCVAFYSEAKRRITLVYLSQDESVSDRDLRLALAKLLPKYMVPTKYVRLQDLPVNNNGKIDRLSLKETYG